jgi:hypothetical protein
MDQELAELLEAQAFRNNPNLRPEGTKIAYTAEMMDEYVKCAQDPLYFIENYVHVVHLDRGIVKMELREYQKRMILGYHDNRKTICLTPRQYGKTITTAAYLLWYIIFNNNKTVAILANKQATADEILHRVRLAYEHLPKWIQSGVIDWNKRSIGIENGSRMFCAATSSSGIRGKAINCVTGETMITIENDDGTIENISMLQLYTNPNSSINKYENITTMGKDFHLINHLEIPQIIPKLNKYHKIYENLMVKCKNRLLEDSVYIEKHHIIPRAIGGLDTEENMVKLTLKEYFFAHKLLVKMLSGKNKGKMLQALYMMSNTRGIRLPSKLYALAKENWISQRANTNHTDESKALLQKAQLDLWATSEYKTKMIAIFGRPETKTKKSQSAKNWINGHPIEHKARMEKINKNPEKIRKTAEWHKGKKRPKETCDKQSNFRKEYITSGGYHNKGMKHYYNPVTNETIQCYPENKPEGWLLGTNKKKPYRGKWCHDSDGNIKAFDPNNIPDGWTLGRK